MPYEEIQEDEFTSFQIGKKPNYVMIEEALIEIGGNGVHGANFKMEILNKAGWTHGKLVSYGKYPDTAAEVFNKVRVILNETQDKDELLARLH